MLRDTLRISQENNRLLHKMRRNSFIGGIVKFIFYILILIVAPLWVYTTYLQPIVQNLEKTNAQTQQQIVSFQNAWKSVESRLPSFGTTSSQ